MLKSGEDQIVVDFSRLVFISSSGMRVLLIAAKKLHAKKGKLVLCSMQDSIREIFSISGFDQIIPIPEVAERSHRRDVTRRRYVIYAVRDTRSRHSSGSSTAHVRPAPRS